MKMIDYTNKRSELIEREFETAWNDITEPKKTARILMPFKILCQYMLYLLIYVVLLLQYKMVMKERQT